MILYRPDQRQMLGLAQLCRLPSVEALMNILQAELQVVTKLMVSADDEKLMRQLQGRAQLINGLFELFEQAKRKETPL